jgi:hypothetical protein
VTVAGQSERFHDLMENARPEISEQNGAKTWKAFPTKHWLASALWLQGFLWAKTSIFRPLLTVLARASHCFSPLHEVDLDMLGGIPNTRI